MCVHYECTPQSDRNDNVSFECLLFHCIELLWRTQIEPVRGGREGGSGRTEKGREKEREGGGEGGIHDHYCDQYLDMRNVRRCSGLMKEGKVRRKVSANSASEKQR